jgi:hypothetical protein
MNYGILLSDTLELYLLHNKGIDQENNWIMLSGNFLIMDEAYQ